VTKDARRLVHGRKRRAGARLLVVAMVTAVPGTTGHPPVALAAALPVLAAQPAPLTVVEPGGLTGPAWSPEPPSVQVQELATLSNLRAPSATQPFALAAAVVAEGAHQDALAARLLHAAPGRSGQQAVAPAPAALKALSFALAQIGRPYLWGGTGPLAFDCSGLTQQAYRHAGVAIPRTSAEQATIGTPVRLADLLPGDLIFYAHDVHDARTIHHVAMYAGDGMLVHSPQPGEFVHLSPVWLDEYIGAVRVVSAVPGQGPGNGLGVPFGPGVPVAPSVPPPGGGPDTPPGKPTGTPTTTPPPGSPGPSTPPPSTPADPPPTTSEPPPSTSDPAPPPTTSEPPPTTSEPPPTTSEPPPSTSDPAPTTSDPAPTTSDPAPTTSDPAPTTSDPAPTTSEPAPTPTESPSQSTSQPSDPATVAPSPTPTETGTTSGP
jgi:peptidoglycan DL-endopeptidase CwlO